MAAVTQNTTPVRHVLGDLVVRVYNVSGVTGSTLTVPQAGLLFVSVQQSTAAGTASLVTSFSVSETTGVGVITFTSSNPMVTEIVMVVSRKG